MQNQLENKVYAGFFVRFAAFAVDSMIAALVVGIVKFPFSIAAMGGANFLKANFIFDYSFLDVLSYVGVAAYFVLLTYFSHSTPGKMLFHLEVVTSKEEWTFWNILYRETIGRFLSSLLCIGYFAVLVQKDKQGFHDMLCDTYVVYKNMASVPTAPKQPAMSVPAGNANVTIPATPVNANITTPAAPVNVTPQENTVSNKQPDKEYQAPTYHQPSAFQVTESHPVQAGAVADNVTDMGNEEEKR